MKRQVRGLLRRLGYEVTPYHPEVSLAARLATTLAHLATDLVLDVGANVGQFAQHLRSVGYQGRIVSFEPLTAAHRGLRANQTRTSDQKWVVADQCAVGHEDTQISINISRNSVSSSVRPMLETHLSAAPQSAYVASETVSMRRLDTIALQHIGPARSVYLKVDTQGYEEQVLNGAERVLALTKAIQLELSLVPLYEGQTLFLDMIRKVEALGFQLYSMSPGFSDTKSGRMYQVDAIFVR